MFEQHQEENDGQNDRDDLLRDRWQGQHSQDQKHHVNHECQHEEPDEELHEPASSERGHSEESKSVHGWVSNQATPAVASPVIDRCVSNADTVGMNRRDFFSTAATAALANLLPESNDAKPITSTSTSNGLFIRITAPKGFCADAIQTKNRSAMDVAWDIRDALSEQHAPWSVFVQEIATGNAAEFHSP